MSLFSFMSIVLPFFLSRASFAAESTLRPFQSISDDDQRTLVSREGSFELGFFSPGNSPSRFLGIWYKNIPVRTVVWVANRCNPIRDLSGSLTINGTGSLVLLYKNKSVVWSPSSSRRARRPILELLDSGNLVLRDEEDVESSETNYLWQSFDYPSDTLLPGMKLGWALRKGLNRKLSAWRNWDDPCPGDLSYGFEVGPHRYPESCVKKGTNKYYRPGPWNGVGFSGAPDIRLNPLFDFRFVENDEELYYMYHLKNSSVVSILVVNQTTSTRQRITWVEADRSWKLYSSGPRDYCDTYGLCGENGICIISENPVCQCLKGFKPKNPEKWNTMDWSGGCVRDKPLSCSDKEKKDGFVKFSSLKMPDTAYSWVNKTMNLKECEAKCISDCSCKAYTNSDIRGEGSGCVIWLSELMDIRKLPSGAQDLYIRMSASETVQGKSAIKLRVLIVTVVVPILGGVSGMLLLLAYCICKSRGLKDNDTAVQRVGDIEEDLELPFFDLSTILTATNDFSASNKLGQGGFGLVYRGKLVDGQEIAVKRLSTGSGQGVDELKNEAKLIAKLQHRNLVKLLGYCVQGEENLLVYEYMPNNSLDSFIFDEIKSRQLDWYKRFQIICGIARGIQYLHQDSRLRIIHRDLKTSNVLLDDEMNPRISDFGMARIFGGDQIEAKSNRVVGTYGYIAPEYAFNGLFSIKSDVFSFGIMVLEIVSGKKSRGFLPQADGLTLTAHAWNLMKQDRAIELLDTSLNIDSSYDFREVVRCVRIGLLCVQQCAVDRPSMSSVVVMLSSEIVLPCPKKPGYFIEKDPKQECSEPSVTNASTISMPEAR